MTLACIWQRLHKLLRYKDESVTIHSQVVRGERWDEAATLLCWNPQPIIRLHSLMCLSYTECCSLSLSHSYFNMANKIPEPATWAYACSTLPEQLTHFYLNLVQVQPLEDLRGSVRFSLEEVDSLGKFSQTSGCWFQLIFYSEIFGKSSSVAYQCIQKWFFYKIIKIIKKISVTNILS